jgi:hypothetical protein
MKLRGRSYSTLHIWGKGGGKDHGRVDWLGCLDEFVQKANFKELVCLHHIKQNNLTYLGLVCTPCLSVSTRIYSGGQQSVT